MKKVSYLLLMLFSCTVNYSCKKNSVGASLKEQHVKLGSRYLATFSITKNSKYLIIFESGLGDGADVWNQKGLATEISVSSDILLYDRAGYAKSPKADLPRNIQVLANELDSVITKMSENRKVVLVAHSLGGMIIRDYTIKRPGKVAGLLFIDPSHELYNKPTQAEEDFIYNTFNTSYGASFGGTMEARDLIEDTYYMQTLPALPNIPVCVLTSMKADASHSVADRQQWFNAHEALKAGVTDFIHISTNTSGHYIMLEQPNLVIDNLKSLLAKLP